MYQDNTLSETQKQIFVDKGYLHLKNVIDADVLNFLRTAIDNICKTENKSNNIAYTSVNATTYVTGINSLAASSETIFASLLGSPLMLSIAESICGINFFPIQDFAVIKNRGDESIVNWHQDVISKNYGKSFMAGIYLDDADEQNGALKIIPDSHRNGLPICELEKMSSLYLSVNAGDMLIHDLMLAHSSGKITMNNKRRVVYMEFMSAEKALAENIYTPDFVELRTSLIPIAMRVFSEHNPGIITYEWKNENRNKYLPVSDPLISIQAIYNTHHRSKASNYCFRM